MNPPPLPGDRIDEADALAGAERLRKSAQRILAECGKVIVGQQDVLEQLLIALFAQGHCLLVGVPGLAKTLMIRTLSESMDLAFKRIQFTPDLMPSDITGTDILQDDRATGQRSFKFIPGPLFANVVLADEINRTPPKTQAALLEAMQEHQVTVGGHRHTLPDPFFVLATQNPIEQEGTYPLPEAQQDRFMFNIRVEYPTEAEEFRIVEATTRRSTAKVEHVVNGHDLKAMQSLVMDVPRRGTRHSLRDETGPSHPPGFAGRPGFHPQIRHLGGRTAGEPIHGVGRQIPGAAVWPPLRRHGGHPGHGLSGPSASHHHELQRGSRGHPPRRPDPKTDRIERGVKRLGSDDRDRFNGFLPDPRTEFSRLPQLEQPKPACCGA